MRGMRVKGVASLYIHGCTIESSESIGGERVLAFHVLSTPANSVAISVDVISETERGSYAMKERNK